MLVALGAAGVTVALSFLPYETVLQAAWVLIASFFIGYRKFSQRLNETDEARYRRLYTTRFAHFERTNPEALNTVFADNLRTSIFQWFESEHGLALGNVPKIDALDSLSRSGDVPGQLIFRAGVHLGQMLPQARAEAEPLKYIDQRVEAFSNENEKLLGEQVGPGMYLRRVRQGEQRPTGIHIFHPASRCLFTIESGLTEKRSLAMSFKSALFEGWSEEQWHSFKQAVHDVFPYFRPSAGGSGPQKMTIPYFISAWMEVSKEEERSLPARIERIMSLLPAPVATEEQKQD